jgi:hypothetical protein
VFAQAQPFGQVKIDGVREVGAAKGVSQTQQPIPVIGGSAAGRCATPKTTASAPYPASMSRRREAASVIASSQEIPIHPGSRSPLGGRALDADTPIRVCRIRVHLFEYSVLDRRLDATSGHAHRTVGVQLLDGRGNTS